MLDLNKPLQTRSGREAKLVEICEDFSIVAAVKGEAASWSIVGYCETGRYHPHCGESPMDLVNPEEKRVLYYNVYDEGFGSGFQSREGAERIGELAGNSLDILKLTFGQTYVEVEVLKP